MTITPGIPTAPDDPRTVPTQAVPFPARLDGRTVLAAAYLPARPGDTPHQAVMILRDEAQPAMRAHDVVSAMVFAGTWSVGSGTPECSYSGAVEIFREHLNYRV